MFNRQHQTSSSSLSYSSVFVNISVLTSNFKFLFLSISDHFFHPSKMAYGDETPIACISCMGFVNPNCKRIWIALISFCGSIHCIFRTWKSCYMNLSIFEYGRAVKSDKRRYFKKSSYCSFFQWSIINCPSSFTDSSS